MIDHDDIPVRIYGPAKEPTGCVPTDADLVRILTLRSGSIVRLVFSAWNGKAAWVDLNRATAQSLQTDLLEALKPSRLEVTKP